MLVTHTQLTFTGKAFLPTISPDGQYIAYFYDEGKDNAKIMVQDIKGGQPLEIFSGIESPHAFWLRWSPEGSELLLSCIVNGSFNIYILPRLGGNARRLPDQYSSCWSPDGSKIASISLDNKHIIFTNKNSGDTTSISIIGDSLWANDIDWSPDGQRLLFSSEAEIWIINADGSQQQKILEDNVQLRSPRWSAEGSTIYYLKDRDATRDLMKIEVATAKEKAMSRPQVLQTGLQMGEILSLSRDNKRLLYVRSTQHSNLWLSKIEGKGDSRNVQMTQLTKGTAYIDCPEISPDGTAIAFTVASGFGRNNLFLMPIEGGPMRQLTFLKGSIGGVAWSPDGEEIAFGYSEGSEAKVWKVDAIGGTLTPFDNSQLALGRAFVSWFPGQDILYKRPGGQSVHILNPDTEEEREMIPNKEEKRYFYNARISPDGKRVAVGWSRVEDWGLMLISLHDSSQKLLHTDPLDPITWSQDGKWIYVIDPYEQPFPIYRTPTTHLNPDTLLVLPFDNIRPDMVSMTPDGKYIISAGIEVQSDVWVMENFDL